METMAISIGFPILVLLCTLQVKRVTSSTTAIFLCLLWLEQQEKGALLRSLVLVVLQLNTLRPIVAAWYRRLQSFDQCFMHLTFLCVSSLRGHSSNKG